MHRMRRVKNSLEYVREEKERGALVIVSCHTAEVLESVADEIYRMDCGRVKEHIVC